MGIHQRRLGPPQQRKRPGSSPPHEIWRDPPAPDSTKDLPVMVAGVVPIGSSVLLGTLTYRVNGQGGGKTLLVREGKSKTIPGETEVWLLKLKKPR